MSPEERAFARGYRQARTELSEELAQLAARLDHQLAELRSELDQLKLQVGLERDAPAALAQSYRRIH